MGSVESYRHALSELGDIEPFLLSHSNLPGPRGNLELATAASDAATAEQIWRWANLAPEAAPNDAAEGFLAFCGVLALGRLLADGQTSPALETLRRLACDPRWRIREAVAMALQRWGDTDVTSLLGTAREWASGNWLEQRAAAAALCEPRLLRMPGAAAETLLILDMITAAIASAPATSRKTEPYRVLRQGLGYCWSVAVAAEPERGLPALARWGLTSDPDVSWIVRENWRKKRLAPYAESRSVPGAE
jgi:hypothetical protein